MKDRIVYEFYLWNIKPGKYIHIFLIINENSIFLGKKIFIFYEKYSMNVLKKYDL